MFLRAYHQAVFTPSISPNGPKKNEYVCRALERKSPSVRDPESLQVGRALNVHNISLCPRHTVSISVVCWAGDKKRSEFQVCLLCRPIRQLCTAVTFRSFRVGIQNRVAQGTTVKVSLTQFRLICILNVIGHSSGSRILMNDIVHHHPEAQADKNHAAPGPPVDVTLRALHCCSCVCCFLFKPEIWAQIVWEMGKGPNKTSQVTVKVSRLTALRSRLFQDRSNAAPVFPLSTIRRQEAAVVQVYKVLNCPPAGLCLFHMPFHVWQAITPSYEIPVRKYATSLFGDFKKSKAAVKSRAVKALSSHCRYIQKENSARFVQLR